MKRITQFPCQLGGSRLTFIPRPAQRKPSGVAAQQQQRSLHATGTVSASVAPVTGSGPAPSAPKSSAQHDVDARIARRHRHAELLKRGSDMRAVAEGRRAGKGKKGTGGRGRFWKEVRVGENENGHLIYLDSRPLRTPSKALLTIPRSKPHLATAIALEWDLLTSAQDALRQHLIPLTSLSARALAIAEEDASSSGAGAENSIRAGITTTVMRYLDTDSLLCWASEPPPDPPGYETHVGRVESLRSIQRREVEPILEYLVQRVWPGVEILVADDGSLVPRPQPEMTRNVVKGWVMGLGPWELAGLERAVLAGKSLLGGVRLIVEWSEELEWLRGGEPGGNFGVEEAVRVTDLETRFQTDMWGEVEDTHDVNNEDLKRQMGSVILLVSGDKSS